MMTEIEVLKALGKLAELERRRRHIQAEIDGIVGVLRTPMLDGFVGATWVEIGKALGVSKQTVQTRYRELSWSEYPDGC